MRTKNSSRENLWGVWATVGMKNLRWQRRRDKEERGLLVFWLREEMERQERENDLEEKGCREAAVRGGETGWGTAERWLGGEEKERCYKMLKETNTSLTIYSCDCVFVHVAVCVHGCIIVQLVGRLFVRRRVRTKEKDERPFRGRDTEIRTESFCWSCVHFFLSSRCTPVRKWGKLLIG